MKSIRPREVRLLVVVHRHVAAVGTVQVAPVLALRRPSTAMCAGSIVSCCAPMTSVGTVDLAEVGGAVPVDQLAARPSSLGPCIGT